MEKAKKNEGFNMKLEISNLRVTYDYHFPFGQNNKAQTEEILIYAKNLFSGNQFLEARQKLHRTVGRTLHIDVLEKE